MEFVCRVAQLEERMVKDLGRVVRAVRSGVVRTETSNKTQGTVKVATEMSEREVKRTNSPKLETETSRACSLDTHSTAETNCWARANVDFTPSPYDDSSLSFRSGQIIKVVERSDSGLWVGECNGRRGKFKFVNVTVLERFQPSRIFPAEHLATPLNQFLNNIGLSDLSPRLILHGFDTVLSLLSLDQHRLSLLGITDNKETEKLLLTIKIIASIFEGLFELEMN